MYKIGELSKLSNIPVKTLRFYDSEGLLPPDEIDLYTGYRYYSAQKLRDCYRILTLKELGFTLEEIKSQSAVPKEDLSHFLASKEQELDEQMDKICRRIKKLRQLQSALKEDNSMYNIVIKADDGFPAVFRRLIIPDKSAVPGMIREIKSLLPDIFSSSGKAETIPMEGSASAGTYSGGRARIWMCLRQGFPHNQAFAGILFAV